MCASASSSSRLTPTSAASRAAASTAATKRPAGRICLDLLRRPQLDHGPPLRTGTSDSAGPRRTQSRRRHAVRRTRSPLPAFTRFSPALGHSGICNDFVMQGDAVCGLHRIGKQGCVRSGDPAVCRPYPQVRGFEPTKQWKEHEMTIRMASKRRAVALAATGASLALVLAACADTGDGGGRRATAAATQPGHESTAPPTRSSVTSRAPRSASTPRSWSRRRRRSGVVQAVRGLHRHQDRLRGLGEFEAQLQVRVEGGNAPDIAFFPQPGLLRRSSTSTPTRQAGPAAGRRPTSTRTAPRTGRSTAPSTASSTARRSAPT